MLLYIHRSRRLKIRDGSPGRPPRLSHSSWALSTETVRLCCLMSLDVGWDQCRSMVQYCFTSTETRRLVRTDSPGRPPRLSHSSWTMPQRPFSKTSYRAPFGSGEEEQVRATGMARVHSPTTLDRINSTAQGTRLTARHFPRQTQSSRWNVRAKHTRPALNTFIPLEFSR